MTHDTSPRASVVGVPISIETEKAGVDLRADFEGAHGMCLEGQPAVSIELVGFAITHCKELNIGLVELPRLTLSNIRMRSACRTLDQ
jgi:hypothetical protein